MGNTLLIHPRGEPDRQAVLFAQGLASDSQHTLVVVDLPSGSLDLEWDAVARLLAGRPGDVRLVFGRGRRHEVHAAGQRIADRLGRTVLAPDGESHPTVDGGLFVPTDQGAGWLLFRPGRAVQADSRRFPKPNWEFAVPDSPWEISPSGVAEPMPSGVWLHSSVAKPLVAHRQRLTQVVPTHPDVLAVVIGSPGTPEVRLDDVARFWESVIPAARPRVRFVHYGPVELPDGSGLGQELADRLEQEVVLYAGLPTGAGTGLAPRDVVGVRADGWPCWRPFVSELVYSPSGGGKPAPPALLGLRAPFPDFREISYGVYEYAPGAVLEVVQSGLWVRSPGAQADGDDVRLLPAKPTDPLILFQRGTPRITELMQALAQDVLWRLDPTVRDAFRVAPADAPGVVLPVRPEALPDPSAAKRRRAAAAASLDEPTAAAPAAPATPATPAALTTPAAQRAPGAASSARAATPPPPRSRTESGRPGADDDLATAAPGAPGTPGTPSRARVESGAPTPVRDASAAPSPDEPLAAPATTDPNVPVPHSGPDGASGSGQRPPTRPGAGAGAGADTGSWARTGDRTQVGTDTPTGAGARAGTDTATHPATGAGTTGSGTRTDTGTDTRTAPATETAAGTGTGTDAGTGTGTTTPAPGPVSPPGAVPGVTPEPLAPAPEAAEPKPALPRPAPPGRRAAPRVRLESGAPNEPAQTPLRPATEGGGTSAPRTSTPAEPAGPPAPAAPAPSAPKGSTAAPKAAAGPPAVRVQPVPKPGACAVPPERGLDQERSWVRRALSEQYNASVGTISGMMAESPGLRGGSRTTSDEALTDLVALRLYLSGDSRGLDAAVRGATTGPHIPLARCVASGLRRLPSYRGPTLLYAVLTQAERAWYREGRLLTEWAFCAARTSPATGPKNSTAFLIWSMTARRTSLIDPAVPDRVVFPPGTSFKVLRAETGDTGGTGNTAGNGRHTVLLRELSPSEISTDGRVDGQRTPLDEIAMNSLEQTVQLLAQAARAKPKAPAISTETPPGLLTSAGARGPRGSARQAATRKARTP